MLARGRNLVSEEAAAITRAPIALPSSTAEMPHAAAAPSTSSVSPACSLARSFRAWMVVPYVRISALATSNGMLSGERNAAVFFQNELGRHAAPAARADDAIADLSFFTPVPTASTTPDTSPPGAKGRSGLNW